jgi:hypothetical protein
MYDCMIIHDKADEKELQVLNSYFYLLPLHFTKKDILINLLKYFIMMMLLIQPFMLNNYHMLWENLKKWTCFILNMKILKQSCHKIFLILAIRLRVRKLFNVEKFRALKASDMVSGTMCLGRVIFNMALILQKKKVFRIV